MDLYSTYNACIQDNADETIDPRIVQIVTGNDTAADRLTDSTIQQTGLQDEEINHLSDSNDFDGYIGNQGYYISGAEDETSDTPSGQRKKERFKAQTKEEQMKSMTELRAALGRFESLRSETALPISQNVADPMPREDFVITTSDESIPKPLFAATSGDEPIIEAHVSELEPPPKVSPIVISQRSMLMVSLRSASAPRRLLNFAGRQRLSARPSARRHGLSRKFSR